MDQKGQRAVLVLRGHLDLLARLDLLDLLDHNTFMKAWWQHYRDALTPMECELVKQIALEQPAQTATVGHGGTSAPNESIRKSSVRWLDKHDKALRWLFDRITLNALEVNQKAFFLRLNNEPRLDYGKAQFTEYSAEDEQHYDWHEDNCWIPNVWSVSDRKLTCVVQLSHELDYEGGRLELERDQPQDTIFRCQGDMIFFPSHLRHRVTPVTKGVRHSLVLWFNGPRLS